MHSGSSIAMEKNRLPSRLQSLKTPKPYIRYDKERDDTIVSVYYDDPEPTTADEFNKLPYDTEWNGNKLEILWKDPGPMTRKQLNIIERIVSYVYHEKHEEYDTLASKERKEQIRKDCKSVDSWLAAQYAFIDLNKRLDKIEKEINEENP